MTKSGKIDSILDDAMGMAKTKNQIRAREATRNHIRKVGEAYAADPNGLEIEATAYYEGCLDTLEAS